MTSSSPGSRVRPYLVTSADAARLPRWIPLLFCAVYVFAGLFGRTPWRPDDAIGFGVAHTMATGGVIDWLLPNVQGEIIAEGGPLSFWLGAIGMQLAQLFNTLLATFLGRAAEPWLISPDLAMRLTAAIGIAIAMVLLWHAARNLAKRPEIQPQDPFGAGASPQDFGHAVADASLLAMLACFGLIAPIHETTANAAQLPCVALFLYGVSVAPKRPRLGGAQAGLAIVASVLTFSIPLAAALLLSLLVLVVWVGPFRLVAGSILGTAVPVVLAGSVLWPGMLAYYGDPNAVVQALPMMNGDHVLPVDASASQQVAAFFAAWLDWNTSLLGLPTAASLGQLVETMPWYLWPLWPFVLWGIIRWRSGCREAPIAAALVPLVLLLLAALFNPQPTDIQHTLLPMVLPAAILTGITLPMIRRSLVSIVDWFAVMIFSVAGFAVWAYWIAFLSGWPPRMATKAQQALPGFSAQVTIVELLIGLAATGAWVALVVWRVSRRPRPFWRPMALSSGGMVLTWLLLMTLWLAAGNHRKSYDELVAPSRALFASRSGCVLRAGIDPGEMAMFAYEGGARFQRLPPLRPRDMPEAPAACPWLLVAEESVDEASASQPINLQAVLNEYALTLRTQNPDDRQAGTWRKVWQTVRPFSKTRRVALYVRNPLAPMK